MARIVSAMIVGIMLTAAVHQAQAGSPSAPLSTPEIKQSISSGKKTIIFFLNPNGGPCRAQNEVLTTLLKNRKKQF